MLDWTGQGDTPIEVPAATSNDMAIAMKNLFIIWYKLIITESLATQIKKIFQRGKY